MTTQATTRKIKRSFTLSHHSSAFVTEVRRRSHARSDSEALDMLLQEAMAAQRKAELDAAVTAYYDNATDEELQESAEWAEMAGRSGMLASEPYEEKH